MDMRYKSRPSKSNNKEGKKFKRAKVHAKKAHDSSRVDDKNIFYGRIMKELGSYMVKVITIPQTEDLKPEDIVCVIPGKFRKRLFFNTGDFVLLEIISQKSGDRSGEIIAPVQESEIPTPPEDLGFDFEGEISINDI